MTTDEVWNTFIKLRMDRVYKGSVEGTGSGVVEIERVNRRGRVSAGGPGQVDGAVTKYSPGGGKCFTPGRIGRKGTKRR